MGWETELVDGNYYRIVKYRKVDRHYDQYVVSDWVPGLIMGQDAAIKLAKRLNRLEEALKDGIRTLENAVRAGCWTAFGPDDVDDTVAKHVTLTQMRAALAKDPTEGT